MILFKGLYVFDYYAPSKINYFIHWNYVSVIGKYIYVLMIPFYIVIILVRLI